MKKFFYATRCLNCGCSRFYTSYIDRLDGWCLLEEEIKCTRCDRVVYFFAYGSEERYTFRIIDLLNNLLLWHK